MGDPSTMTRRAIWREARPDLSSIFPSKSGVNPLTLSPRIRWVFLSEIWLRVWRRFLPPTRDTNSPNTNAATPTASATYTQSLRPIYQHFHHPNSPQFPRVFTTQTQGNFPEASSINSGESGVSSASLPSAQCGSRAARGPATRVRHVLHMQRVTGVWRARDAWGNGPIVARRPIVAPSRNGPDAHRCTRVHGIEWVHGLSYCDTSGAGRHLLTSSERCRQCRRALRVNRMDSP